MEPISALERRLRRATSLRWLFAASLVVLCLIAFFLAVAVGAAGISLQEVFASLISWFPGLQKMLNIALPSERARDIVMELRLPRAVVAFIVGAGLGVAGAIMQSLFRNPMAEPYLLGVSSGAALGASAAMLFRLNLNILGLSSVPVLAFVGGAGVSALIYVLGRTGRGVSMTTLLLAGIAVGSFIAAVNALLMLYMQHELRGLVFWMMGGFSLAGWEHVRLIFPYAVAGLFLALFFARDLDALMLGEEQAVQLGVKVERVRKVLLATATLLAAAAVSVAGIIGFVGLVVPHIARPFTGAMHRALLPGCALCGAVVLLLSDVVARTVVPQELPVGIITAMLGTPFFLYILLVSRRKTFQGW